MAENYGEEEGKVLGRVMRGRAVRRNKKVEVGLLLMMMMMMMIQQERQGHVGTRDSLARAN